MRSNKDTPNASSNCASAWLAADCDSATSAAARVTDSQAATAANTSSSRSDSFSAMINRF